MAKFVKIEHRLGVQTPVDAVWEVIADLPAWNDWNPYYRHIDGELGYRRVLTFEVNLPGEPSRVISPQLETWTPLELIHWRMSEKRGFLRTTHYLELESLSDQACIFSNGEMFEGYLGLREAKRLRRPMRNARKALSSRNCSGTAAAPEPELTAVSKM